MIEINTKVHDKYSIEFKVGFVTRRKTVKNDFTVGMWIFVPGSLDITPSTYSKSDFYRDVKSNVRLITPSFILRDIVDGAAIPLNNVRKAADAMASDPTRGNTAEFVYQMKMFAAIVKSALREETNYILTQGKKALLIDQYTDNLKSIIAAYVELEQRILTPSVGQAGIDAYNMSGDFMCTVAIQHSLKLLKAISPDASLASRQESLRELVHGINSLRHERGYSSTTDVYRHGVLKKYVESQLYLRVPKKRDGVLVEQAYYSLAAGLAMLFATVVAWAFQRRFGNLTWPLFIALVISYMMKDRIKELTRYYFAHKISSKYFDNKARINIKDRNIGSLREAVDFIPRHNVPDEIMKIRKTGALFPSDNLRSDEKVILYRKLVHIDRDKMMENATYNYSGVNDIIRLQVNSFLHKMDNPLVPLNTLSDDGTVREVLCPKEYYLNIVLKYEYDSTCDYKHFRITLDRDGIKGIEEIAV